MGHRRDAVEALREFAHDLESTTFPGGVTYRVGSSHQDDERRVDHDLGAPQLRVLVASVAVVLVGLVGIGGGVASASATPATKAAAPITEDTVLRDLAAAGSPAVRALAKMGDADAAAAVAAAQAAALTTGVEPSAEALARIETLAAAIVNGHGRPGDADELVEALGALGNEPSLTQDEDFTPPGQDENFTPPGQDENFTPPGQDENFTPPGQGGKP